MNATALTDALVSQYEAALEMLRASIEAAPDEVWDSPDYENRTWRLVYHTLYYTKLYVGPSAEAFSEWEGAIEGAESLGGSWEDPSATVEVEGVHSPGELVTFLDSLLSELPDAVRSLPLDAESGFEWYPYSRFELHLNTLRHIQHHTGQIMERLRSHGVTGIAWATGADAVGW